MTTEHGFDIPARPGIHREHPGLSVDILAIFPSADGEIMETVRVMGHDARSAIDTIRLTEKVHPLEVLS